MKTFTQLMQTVSSTYREVSLAFSEENLFLTP